MDCGTPSKKTAENKAEGGAEMSDQASAEMLEGLKTAMNNAFTEAVDSPEEKTAKQIALLLGVSDRQVRIYRQQLEWVYYWKTEALKGANGSYTQFALACLKDLQAKTSCSIPILDRDGNPVMDRKTGKVKRQRIKKVMDLEDYAAMVWREFRRPPNPASFLPNPTAEVAEEQAEFPAEAIMPEVLPPEDSIESERLSFSSVDGTEATINRLENTSAISSDIKASVTSFKKALVTTFGEFGNVLGSEAVQSMAYNFQKTVYEGMEEMAKQTTSTAQEPQKAKTVQRKTRKAG